MLDLENSNGVDTKDMLQAASYGSAEISNASILALTGSLFDSAYVSTLRNLGKWIHMLQELFPGKGDAAPTALIHAQKVAEKGFLTSIEAFMEEDPSTYTHKVDMHEGFPTVDGLPIWERLEGELPEYFNYFKQYRELVEKSHNRTMFQLAELTGQPLPALNALSIVYHWRIRNSAYDQYKEMLYEKERAKLLRQMENAHQRKARTLFDTAVTYLENNIERLDPKTATQLLETAVKLERLSLGVSPDKPISETTQKQNNAQLIQINGGQVSVSQGESNKDVARTDGGSKTSDILAILMKAGAFTMQPESEIDATPNTTNGTGEIIEIVPEAVKEEVLDLD